MPRIKLTNLLAEPGRLVRLAGAHDALGAKIAESVGFDGIWASSLAISLSQGCADTGANTMTHVLSASTSIAASVSCPVVADCGPVTGNLSQVVDLVKAYEASGVAAICLEDSRYPKLNSLLAGRHDLASIDEFSEVIRTACEARRTPGFQLIARLESLIAGEPLPVAFERACAYVAAGADAILVHSRAISPDEILGFVEAWNSPVPLVLVPTTYFSLSEHQIQETGKVKMVIYANQGIRAAMTAMRKAFEQILKDGTGSEVHKWIAPLDDLFEIQPQRDETIQSK